MPKLNITHLPTRLKERLEKLERGEEVAAKDIKSLLSDEQIKRLEKAWAEQEMLRKTHKRPKTEEEANAIGWKTKLQVRIDTYRQAIEESQDGLVEGIRKLQRERETKAAKVWLDAVFNAKQGTDKWSAGNIALTRAGFNKGTPSISKRDKEVWAMEEAIRKQIDNTPTKQEKSAKKHKK